MHNEAKVQRITVKCVEFYFFWYIHVYQFVHRREWLFRGMYSALTCTTLAHCGLNVHGFNMRRELRMRTTCCGCIPQAFQYFIAFSDFLKTNTA